MSKTEWSLVQADHNWTAWDSDREFYSFKGKPFMSSDVDGGFWDDDDKNLGHHLMGTVSVEDALKWKDSLEERPSE